LPVYDEKVDVWSMGVVLYEALSGLQPFLADSAADMLTVIGKKMAKRLDPDQQPPQPQHYQHHRRRSGSNQWVLKPSQELPAFIARLQLSPDAKDFLACCLTWDPTKRPSAGELLSHPWLLRMQDEAAAVAASRANSRRISMQISMQRARLSDDNGVSVAAAAAVAAADVSRSQLLQAAGEEVSLVDPIVAGMLDRHHHDAHYERKSSLDLGAAPLERSQTSEQLEVGAHNVLRTHTQRLDARPKHARVHAA
jgi:serine/threonine protein kinase